VIQSLMGLSLLLSAVMAGNSPGASREECLSSALKAFDAAVATRKHSGLEAQRLYRKALAGFQSLLEDGVRTGALYYNIANTHLRLGDVGRAVANYRRALRLDPSNGRIQKNLETARKMVEVRIERPAASAFLETLFFWHYGTSPAARLRVVLVTYAAFWILLLIRLAVLRRSSILTTAAFAVAALCLICSASVVWEEWASSRRAEGVLVGEKVVLRKGNGDYYDPQFQRPLPPGVEFYVLESRSDVQGTTWYHVELPDGQDGWVRADQADII
jgi:tetratricopeptide (TPR) repeat protein